MKTLSLYSRILSGILFIVALIFYFLGKQSQSLMALAVAIFFSAATLSLNIFAYFHDRAAERRRADMFDY